MHGMKSWALCWLRAKRWQSLMGQPALFLAMCASWSTAFFDTVIISLLWRVLIAGCCRIGGWYKCWKLILDLSNISDKCCSLYVDALSDKHVQWYLQGYNSNSVPSQEVLLVGDTSFPAISSTWLHRYYLNWIQLDDAITEFYNEMPSTENWVFNLVILLSIFWYFAVALKQFVLLKALYK